MDKFRYFFREAIKSIWINRMMSLASISVLTVCLVLLGTSLLLSLNISNIIKQIENQNQIMVFLNDNLDTSSINSVGDQISALPYVKQCIYVSKQEALDEQKKSLGSNSDLLAGYENDNPLPNAYRIVLNNMAGFSQTVKELYKIPGIIQIKQQADVAEKLNKINQVIRLIGGWLFALLALVSLFIISNTIKLAMFVRKREVNIMKFVGATDWFIRWPFIVEGMLIGFLSGCIAFIFQWYIYAKLIKTALQGINFMSLVYYHNMFTYIFLCFVGAGLVVGSLGSVISMRKYLKV